MRKPGGRSSMAELHQSGLAGRSFVASRLVGLGRSVPQVCSWSPSLWLSCASQPEQTASIKVTTGRKTGKNRRNQSTVFWSCWWSRQPEKFGFVNLFVHQTMWMGGDRRWIRSYHGLVKSFFCEGGALIIWRDNKQQTKISWNILWERRCCGQISQPFSSPPSCSPSLW